MRLLFEGGLDSHHLGFLLLIALATFLVLSARAVVAGSRRVCHILQGPFLSVVHKLHERISMVPWGVFRLTTSPFFYLSSRLSASSGTSAHGGIW